MLLPEQEAVLEEGRDGAVGHVVTGGRRHPVVRSLTGNGSDEVKVLVRGSPADGSRGEAFEWVGQREPQDPATVLRSLEDAFRFLQEDPARCRKGLRLAQLGAVHATLGYWTTGSTEPATIVMPTGTGKTEVMVALLACARPSKLLIVVPSDALRAQLAAKFESFGILQRAGVIAETALRPIVGQVQHGFSSASAARDFAAACNVIIATPQALAAAESDARAELLSACSHLFVDEAHHVAATTWRQIRDGFADKPVVQFTATPFREDGKHLGGRLLYTFPLREAQKHRFFSKINYIPVINFGDPDRAIAIKAVEKLRRDLAAGLDHSLMARVKRIGRTSQVLDIYDDLAADLNPVVLHSTRPAADRSQALQAVRTRESRIIVCVDMLGEGFDLPSLKIAAIHDPHKSLGITLQFVGRFARVAGESIGDATVIVGRPDRDYDPNLRQLYAEDAEWDLIIRDLSERAVGYQQEVSDFEQGFGSLPDEVSLRNILPKMSTVVYRATCDDWDPLAINSIYPEDQLLTVPIGLNMQAGVAWFITEIKSQVRWGDFQAVEEVSYHLYVLYWDRANRLLYINSSNNDSMHEDLAKSVCGDGVSRISGETVYRVMAQVNRLVPTNVGVLDVRNRARRFSMHVGADVTEGFPIAEAQTKTKTNIFAYGYENGGRTSIGASLKGRIWSYRVADSLKHWVDWCDHVGSKLTDDTISLDEVMRNFIRPKVIDERPPYIALALEWPYEFFRSTSEEVRLEYEGSSWPLVDTDLVITAFAADGPIPFKVATPDWSADYELALGSGSIAFRAMGPEATIVSQRSVIPLSSYLNKHGLIVHFEQDALVVPPGLLLRPDRTIPPFDLEQLHALDWSGVNIRRESQGPARDQGTVQARVIEHVLALDDWDVLIDDDGSGEIADIVAMRADDRALRVHLVHCKFSSEDAPGYRVSDLYEVCGQAQKSIRWRLNTSLFFQHLIRREKKRQKLHGYSGLMKGSGATLYELEEKARFLKAEFRFSIAQPGVSKARVSAEMLELLACTEVYIYETTQSPFDAFCSA